MLVNLTPGIDGQDGDHIGFAIDGTDASRPHETSANRDVRSVERRGADRRDLRPIGLGAVGFVAP
jgi:hypothetical protein